MPENLLDCHNVSKLRQAVADRNSRALERLPFDTISIGALVEICCANYYWREANDEDGIEVFRRLALIVPTLNTISERLLRAIREPTGCQFQPGESNLVLNVVAQKQAFHVRSWSEFQQGFVRTAKSFGFEPGFALALSAAFGEIAENVPDHSAPAGSEMAAAILGYFIAPGELHFAVGDLGRGVLTSLRENPHWAALKDSRNAILATLEQSATRKAEHQEGTGFKLALKSFVDRNGILAVSSGDAVARVGRDNDGRHVVSGFAPWLNGTCVAASCFMKGTPTERAIP